MSISRGSEQSRPDAPRGATALDKSSSLTYQTPLLASSYVGIYDIKIADFPVHVLRLDDPLRRHSAIHQTENLRILYPVELVRITPKPRQSLLSLGSLSMIVSAVPPK